MQGFLIWAWDIILPGCSGTSLSRVSPRESAYCGWDFHTVRSGIDPADFSLRPRYVGVIDI